MATRTDRRGSVVDRARLATDELAARGLGRLRENGFGGLEPRERITLSVVTTMLVGGFLLVVVLVLSPGSGTATSSPQGSEEAGAFSSSSIVAAARAQTLLLSFDQARREQALTEDVVPEQVDAVRSAFEQGVSTIRQSTQVPETSTAATLVAQPSGFRLTYANGNVAQVSLWSEVAVDPDPATAGDETTWWATMGWTMRYAEGGWTVYSFDGSENGPEPGSAGAEEFTLLPGAG